MDPRPTLQVTNLSFPAALRASRKRDHLSRLASWTKQDKQKLYRVMYTFRTKQRALTDDDPEDPSPYTPTYVFYCLSR